MIHFQISTLPSLRIAQSSSQRSTRSPHTETLRRP
jgi:hypothetical protein